MTDAERMQRALRSIGWTQLGTADRLGVAESTFRRWCSSPRYPPPPVVLTWLETLAAAHDAAQLPEGWAR